MVITSLMRIILPLIRMPSVIIVGWDNIVADIVGIWINIITSIREIILSLIKTIIPSLILNIVVDWCDNINTPTNKYYNYLNKK